MITIMKLMNVVIRMIQYKINNQQVPESTEIDSEIEIFHNNKSIANLSESSDGIEISGNFEKYLPSKDTDEEGVPLLVSKSIELKLKDLMDLQRLCIWWFYEGEEPTDLLINKK